MLLSPERENHCVYVVLSGRLTVHLGSLDAPKIADLGPGSCAGEMSLIENKDPSAFVVATENCHLMVISHTLLWRLVDRSHTFCKNLLIVLSERVRSDNEYIASSLGVLRQAERNAHTDALTGLGNRHWMRTMFEREVTRTLHSKKALCLMMIDVDNFKVFNDQYGHIAGDRVLVAVADALREYLRPTDLVARFGGDEFAVLLPDLQVKQARQTAERIRQQIAGLSPPSLSTAITVSIGIADRADHDDVATLVQRADAAMYEAKVAGRNRVSVSRPQTSKLSMSRARPSRAAASTIRCSLAPASAAAEIPLAANLDVLRPKPRSLEVRSRVGGQTREIARTAAQLVSHARQRPVQRRRLAALGRIEITIARAHREPVGLAVRRRHAQLHGQTQIRDHALHQHELLIVLLAQEQHVGRHDVQQPADDRRDAVEVPRPARAAELAAQRPAAARARRAPCRTDRSRPCPARTGGRHCRQPRSAPHRPRACADRR